MEHVWFALKLKNSNNNCKIILWNYRSFNIFSFEWFVFRKFDAFKILWKLFQNFQNRSLPFRHLLDFCQTDSTWSHTMTFTFVKVVLTQATHLYFDHPYEPDPEERGYYWAPRFIDTRKTFGFIPDDVYANADFTRMGDPIVNLCEEMYKGKCVPLKKPQNIAGSLNQVKSIETISLFLYDHLLKIAINK